MAGVAAFRQGDRLTPLHARVLGKKGELAIALLFVVGMRTVHGSIANGEGPAILVKDLNAEGEGSWPSHLVNVDGTLFFFAAAGDRSVGLWKSDGSEQGTVRITAVPARPSEFVAVDRTLFFAIQGAGLWTSDGTAPGTRQLSYETASCLINAGAALFFFVPDGDWRVLWKSDGTIVGTTAVKDLRDLTTVQGCLVSVNGTVYFAGLGVNRESALWKSDGTAAGTQIVLQGLPALPVQLTALGDRSSFLTVGGETTLWVTDGTAAGTLPLQTFPGTVAQLIEAKGALVVAADGRLWQSDGTVAGTAEIEGVSSLCYLPFKLTRVDDGFFFSCFVPHNGGYELWKSDGSLAGTQRVKELPVSYRNVFSVDSLIDVRGTVFFTGGANNVELWKSDGTEAGTVKIATFAGAGAGNLTAVNDQLLFTGFDEIHGPELWKSDGTASGTVVVTDIDRNTLSANPSELTDLNGTLYFSAGDLWRSDGSPGGTMRVARPGGELFVTLDDTLFYVQNGTLWKSDGTDAGTVEVRAPIYVYNAPTSVNGALYFAADGDAAGVELWRSDGTTAGTRLVKNIYADPPPCRDHWCFPDPGLRSSFPSGFVSFKDEVFFGAFDDENGNGLWKTDGTEAGTRLVKAFGGTQDFETPWSFKDINGTLFFGAHDEVYGGVGLWKSDGTGPGTTLVHAATDWSGSPSALTNVNGRLFLLAPFGGFVNLWRSDGTTAGTQRLHEFALGASDLIDVGGVLSFLAAEPAVGNAQPLVQLWRSDGTVTGTTPVTGSDDEWLTAGPMANVNGTLVFFTDGPHGAGLWQSHGTADSTIRLQDLGAAPTDLARSSFTVSGTNLFFAATDRSHGTELWALPLSYFGPPCIGDCHRDGTVTVDELLQGVNIALGNSIAEACPPMDIDGSGTVTVNELVLAVSSVLNGCS